MLRVISLFLISLTIVFSATLTQEQINLAKQAGISEADIKKQLSKTEEKNQTEPKEQIVENDLTKEVSTKVYSNLFMKNKEEKKDIENKRDEKIDIKREKELQRYGSLFFNNKNKINPYAIPTPSNYKLNFGDKITLTIYGATSEEFELYVNKDGKVTIPQVGEKKVIGLDFSTAKELILEETKKAYPNSTNILIDMTEFSSIQVTVTGLVSNPGIINLSSFSTIKDALVASGEILDNGSYRNILLKRAGKVIKTFDLYSLVRYGDTKNDTTLQNGDVILVKPVNKEIKLTGDVNFNAIFELKNGEKFKNLLDFASGLKPSANKNAIQLKRYENNSIKVYTLNLNELYSFSPKNGDEVHIYPLSVLGTSMVEVLGNVIAPGEREIPKDKKLSTLLKNELETFGKQGYFKNNTNYNFATIKNDNKLKSFNLENVLSGIEDISLKKGDKITIYENSELKKQPYVYAKGNIVDDKNKKYDFYEGMVVEDLFDLVLFKTEKMEKVIIETDKDYRKVKVITNKSDENLKFSIIENTIRKPMIVDKTKVQINRVEDGRTISYIVDKAQMKTFKLKAYDEVTFFEYFDVNEIKQATIKGEVFIPGTYYISKNTTIKDLIKLAGGVTKKAYWDRFELTRYEIKKDRRERTVMSLDLNKAFKINFKIFEDDEITIFPIANWNAKKYVELKGLVRFPGKYPIADGEKLSSVIERAGGFLSDAFIEGAVFTRKDVQELQQKRLDESLSRLKMQLFSGNLSATDAGENSAEKTKMINTVNLLEKEAATNKPIGRVSLNLYYDLNRFKNSNYDIVLKDGDVLSVPSMNDTVSVVGEVLNQNTFVYDNKLDVDDYISKAGGLNTGADDEFIYVVKANGEAKKYEKNFFWQNGVDIFKGDTIVVPVKLDTMSDIAFAKDVTQILYQIAITAASLKTLGTL